MSSDIRFGQFCGDEVHPSGGLPPKQHAFRIHATGGAIDDKMSRRNARPVLNNVRGKRGDRTPTSERYQHNHRRGGGSRSSFQHHSHVSSFGKGQHVHSHFHFAVEPRKEFLRQPAFYEADERILWESVCLVLEPSGVLPACPICLEPPVCAVITPCAHAFCYACVLHILSLSETSWAKCPLCYEHVEVEDLKPIEAAAEAQQAITLGSTMRMVRLTIEAGSVCPDVADSPDQPALRRAQRARKSERFRRLHVMTNARMQAITERERNELNLALSHPDTTEMEAVFLEMAKERINLRYAQWQQCRYKDSSLSSSSSSSSSNNVISSSKKRPSSAAAVSIATPVNAITVNNELRKPVSQLKPLEAIAAPPGLANSSKQLSRKAVTFVPLSELKQKVTREDSSPSSSSSSVDAAPSSGSSVNVLSSAPPSAAFAPSSSICEFYQSSDGQLAFLHSLNFRCLQFQASSSSSQMWTEVSGKVLDVEEFILTPDLRKRYRFLSHVPSMSSVKLIFLDLTDSVDKSTLARFHKELVKMKQKIQRKRAERKRVDREYKKNEQIKLSDTFYSAQELAFMQSASSFELASASAPEASSFPLLGGQHAAHASPQPQPQPQHKANWSRVAVKGFAYTDEWSSLPSSSTADYPSLGPSSSSSSSAAVVENAPTGLASKSRWAGGSSGKVTLRLGRVSQPQQGEGEENATTSTATANATYSADYAFAPSFVASSASVTGASSGKGKKKKRTVWMTNASARRS